VENRKKSVRGPISRVLSRKLLCGGDHSSRTVLARDLLRPTRTTSAKPDMRRPYLVLLRMGFTVTARLAVGPVRSYRTLSAFPARARRHRRVVFSLWHCPWSHLRRALSGILLRWSPDFPRHSKVTRPPSPLTCALNRVRPLQVKGYRHAKINHCLHSAGRMRRLAT